jgi:hypothetical protein
MAHWWPGPAGQRDPHVSRTRAGLKVDRRFLAVGEITGNEVTTNALLSTSTHKALENGGAGAQTHARRRSWRCGCVYVAGEAVVRLTKTLTGGIFTGNPFYDS